ncbi:MAG: type I restriction endonuclease subunit R [Spirochaetota bacterium]
MSNTYTEDQLVEQPAIHLFSSLGWQTINATEETFGVIGSIDDQQSVLPDLLTNAERQSLSGARSSSGAETTAPTLARETKSEVVLTKNLSAALKKLNPKYPADAIQKAIDEITRDRSAMSLVDANREVYQLLKEGVKVNIPDNEHGGEKTERVRVIDWQNPKENDFLLVSQMTITGPLYTCRPDLIGFVNGLPFVLIELKKPGVPAEQAFNDNLTSYKHIQNGIPALLWYNAMIIASNGTESRVGSLTADWERFFEWKRIESEDEPRCVSLETMIRGVCDKSRLIDLVENFTIFSEHEAGLVKILAQNHQFLGVNKAIKASMKAKEEGHGRGGVFWQTQGSGKSFSMVFYAQKIMRTMPGNWTFVVITDRTELDDQIAKTFKKCGAVSEAEGDECHAESGAHLRQLLGENHRYIFTLIHKFQTNDMLCDRSDVIVLTDEAHRSQYDTLAVNMRAALPKALFLAFTGTPLIAGEERTKEVFGGYVSIYDFQQSIEDGATVRLFYENRTPELKLENPSLNDDIYSLIEDADLNDAASERLERELGRQYHLITRDERLDTIAKDIVTHFLGRGFQGKAMVVSIDKATAFRMYDKVRQHWLVERKRVEAELTKARKDKLDGDRISGIADRFEVLKTTDMALIVSPGQNEIEQMKALGLDIVPHRKRMKEGKLDEHFKADSDPLRLVFVCAMWLTGFDAPSCSTIYLDKPMRNHTLMQTIARANRVYPGKHSGMIVDYANVFASLEKALAIYGKGSGGTTPVKDKKLLVEDLRVAVDQIKGFCAKRAVDLDRIVKSEEMEKLQHIADAINILIEKDQVRKDFLGQERLIHALFNAIKPDTATLEFMDIAQCVAVISDSIRVRTGEAIADISGIMGKISDLLDESIATEGFSISLQEGKKSILDLSKIDFDALLKRFKKSKSKNIEVEQLKTAIRARIERMVAVNKTRADYLKKFEELIESYNSGSRNIEDLFKELLASIDTLTTEETRHVREQLSEEELTIFDILTRPAPEMSSKERDAVKKVARVLLEKIRSNLSLNWRQKAQARAQVRLAIEDTLDEGLPKPYTPQVFQTKVELLFSHFYETYPDNEIRLSAS